MGRVYRSAKSDQMELEKARTLIMILREMRACLESEMLVTLEQRMAAIQARGLSKLPHLGSVPPGSTVDVPMNGSTADIS
jgi:hypothetical protein